MPFINSSQARSLPFYRAANPNVLFAHSNAWSANKEVSNGLKLNCKLQLVEPHCGNPEQQVYAGFLNQVFTAQLPNHFDDLAMSSLSAGRYSYYAKATDTLIEVEEKNISLSAPNEEKLTHAIFKLAVLIYRSYPNISLVVDCPNIRLKKALEQVLDQAFLAVANDKVTLAYARPQEDIVQAEMPELNPALSSLPSAPPAWMMI